MSLKKLGRYDLIRVLGKGAMGLVYEGRDPNLDRRVAIKTIKVENLSDEAAAEYEVRFRVEARSAARLQHPHIVSVYDSDRDLDIAYLVMEFVEGEDLKHHLDAGFAYTLEQTLRIMADLLSALSYAHQQNVVHRDIKPANLLVIAGGHIKLADFGVARIQDSGDTTRTQGTIVGTLKYMSPEQLEGKPIDARTDLFAAGVVLYQLLTGQRPFDGENDFAVIQKIVSYQPAAPTSFNAKLPSELDAVLAKALAKSRDARYATAQDFADALQAACKQAADITIAPTATAPAKGTNTTWTATMMPGESLMATGLGLNTSIGTSSGTSSGLSASLVTQEVELVYWKDIKESEAVEDLQGFLNKFPLGIYADLARRRLKNLGGFMLPDASKATIIPAPGLLTNTAADEKTVLLPRSVQTSIEPTVHSAPSQLPDAAAVATHPVTPATSGPIVQALPEPTAITSAPLSPTPSKKRGLLWAGAGVALAAIGIMLAVLPRPAQPPEVDVHTNAPVLTGLTEVTKLPASPASAAASSPAGSAAVVVSSVLTSTLSAAISTTTAPISGVTALPPAKVARPLLAASKAASLVVAKTPAKEERQPVRPNAAEPPGVAAIAQPPKTATAVVADSPSAACEGRFFIGFQNCMNEQCAKVGFSQHGQCIERRAMENRRKEAEFNRY